MEDNQTNIGEVNIKFGDIDQAITKAGLLPFRIVVIGDFTPGDRTAIDWSKGSHLIDIDKNLFSRALEKLSPSLNLAVTNHIDGDASELILEMRFHEINDFRPEGIGKLVPIISHLLIIRQSLTELLEKKIAPEEFQSRLSATGIPVSLSTRVQQLIASSTSVPSQRFASPDHDEPKISSSGQDSISSILDLVDATTSVPQPAPREISSGNIAQAINILLGKEQPSSKIDREESRTILSDIDQKIEKQVNEILHHPQFQQLESTWRGLKFLVDRIDFRKNIQLQILSVPKLQLPDAIYHQLMMPEYNEVSDTPLSLMIADYEFDRSADDLEILQNMARMAAAIQVPVITNVGTAFFGIKKGTELANLPDFKVFFKGPDYFNWIAFRDKSESQYITLVTPNFLLRYAYGNGGVAVKDFRFKETSLSETDFLWGRGAYALASVIARSFVTTGWPIQVTGMESGGKIENLPIWKYPAPGGRDIRIPLNSLMRESKQIELTEQGFVVLGFVINSNNAFVLSAPTFYRAPIFDDSQKTKEAALHATLAYQLFSSRMAHYLRLIKKEISPGMTPGQIKEVFASKLRGVLSTKDFKAGADTVYVEVSEISDRPEQYYVAMRIIPPFRIAGYQPGLLLGLEVRR